jgi:hypothetical protein
MPDTSHHQVSTKGPRRRFGLKAGVAATLGLAMVGGFGLIAAPSASATNQEPQVVVQPPGTITAVVECHTDWYGANDGTFEIMWTLKNDLIKIVGNDDKDPIGPIGAVVINTSNEEVFPEKLKFDPEQSITRSQSVDAAGAANLSVTLRSKEGNPQTKEYTGTIAAADFPSCPMPSKSIVLPTCTTGLVVNLANYPTGRVSMHDGRGGWFEPYNVAITIDDGATANYDLVDGAFTFNGPVPPTNGTQTGRITITGGPDGERSADYSNLLADEPWTVTCASTTNTVTNTVTVPGPTATATVTASPIAEPVVTPTEAPTVAPEPATSPTAEPTVEPEAGTAPTSVNAGGGSSAPADPAFPIWAVALLAVGAVGAVGASARLASSRKH